MACSSVVSSQTISFRYQVYSKGGTSPGNAHFIPLSSPDLEGVAAELAGFRGTLRLESPSLDVKVQLAWQTSEDGENWAGLAGNAWETLGPDLTSAAVKTSPWYEQTNNLLRAVRWGVVVSQSSGTGIAFGLVTVTLDLLRRS